MPTSDRIPPYNEEMERCLLGAILHAAERVVPMLTMLGVTPDVFYVPAHQSFYETINDMVARSLPIDLATVPARMKDTGILERIGGHPFVERVYDACPTAAHAQYYAEQILELHAKRFVIRSAQAALLSAYEDAEQTAEQLVASLTAELAGAVKVRTDDKPMSEIALDLVNEWERGEVSKNALQWPLASLRGFIGDLTDEYIVLAAQPSVGKTALALQFAVYNAEAGRRVAMASLESSRVKIAGRLIAFVGQCRTLRMRQQRHATEKDYERGRDAAARIGELPISIYHGGMTISQLRAWGYREKSKGATCLIIDNMKHIRPDKVFKNRFDQFAECSLQLKFLRDDLEIPLLVLHHLNAEDKLSWSSDIERDADQIVTMCKNEEMSCDPTQKNDWTGRSVIDVMTVKNREGGAGSTIKLLFDKPVQTFREWDNQPAASSHPVEPIQGQFGEGEV